MGAAALISERARRAERLAAAALVQGWKVWISPLPHAETGWRVNRVGGGLAYTHLDDAIAVAKIWLRAYRVKDAVPYA